LKDLLSEIPDRIPALEHVRGSVRVDVGTEALGILRVEDGHVTLLPSAGHAEAVITTAGENDLQRLLHGEMNAIVATIQGNIDLEGDVALAARILYALQADLTVRKRRDAKARATESSRRGGAAS
jgi:hypothetical protein